MRDNEIETEDIEEFAELMLLHEAKQSAEFPMWAYGE